MKYIAIYLILINALSLLLMLIDKIKAKKKLWRIPEKVLLGVCAIGGLLGMKLFHHKTLHPQFSIGIPVMLALQIVLAVVLFVVL